MRSVARMMIAFLLLAHATLLPASAALPGLIGLRGETCGCACAQVNGACCCCTVQRDVGERDVLERDGVEPSCRCSPAPMTPRETPVAPPPPAEERAPQKSVVDGSPATRTAVALPQIVDDSVASRYHALGRAVRPSRHLFLALRCQWLK